MAVISFVSPKGGVGKTTAAVILASELSRSGEKITLIDADPNKPIVRWQNLGSAPPSLRVIEDKSEDTILDNIGSAARDARMVIVDLEGTASLRVSYAISRSDLVLIPVKGSMLDAQEAAKAINLIHRTEQAFQRDIPYAVLYSQMPAAIMRRNFKDIKQQFVDLKVPTLDTHIIEREAYRTIFSIGGTVHNLTDRHVGGLPAAKENSSEYASEVISLLRAHRNMEKLENV